MLEVRLFGRLELLVDGHAVPLPASRRARSLLAYLAAHPGSHSRAHLASTFWPDVLDSSARTSLRGALAELRKCLGPAEDRLWTPRHAVELSADGVWVDSRAFARHLRDREWSSALDLATGQLLPEMDEDWVVRCREEHAAALLTTLTESMTLAEAGGRIDDAVALARRRVGLDPLSELAGRDLVRLLADSGDRSAALEAGRELVARLRQELEVEPDRRTLSLLEEIRTGPPGPGPAPPVSVPPAVQDAATGFVGRGALLTEIDAVRRAGHRIVVLSGEAGIGKTTTALAAAGRAAAQNATVLVGRCDEHGIVPYAPWVEALGQVLAEQGDDYCRRVATAGDGELARLLPQLRPYREESATPVAAEPDTLRWRLFEAVSDLIASIAAGGPLVLVLDDVHWADRPSVLLLRHLLRTRGGLPVTVLMTTRDDEAPEDAPLHDVLAQLRRDETVVTLRLSGLQEAEVAELVRRRRGDGVETGLVRALHQETEGNPFFVEEILRNTPRLHATGDSADGRFTVPQGVRDVVRRRLRGLDDRVREVLAVAAVVGRDFELSVVDAAVDAGTDAVVAALDAAVQGHLVDELGIGSYVFSHALIRSAFYDGLTRTRRAHLHLRVARALESTDDWSPPGHARQGRASLLAHHYLASGDPRHLDRVLEHLGAAYREAMAQCAYEDAARQAARALSSLDSARHQDGRRPALLVQLGEAQSRSGDHEAARATFSQVAVAARARGDARLLAAAALGFAGPSWRGFGTVDPDDVRLLEEALAAAPDDDPALVARVQARLAIALYFARNPDRVAALTEEATSTARRLDDMPVLAAAMEARLWATWRPDAVDERLATADELLALAHQHGAEEVAAMARRWRVVALLELGQMPQAWDEVARHAEDASRLQLPYEQLYVTVFTTMRALLEGRLEDALAGSATVAAFGEIRGGADALQYGGVHAFTLAQLNGDLSPVAGALELFVAGYPDLPGWRGALAYVLVGSGREGEAAEQVEALWPPEQALPYDANWLPACFFLALAVLHLEDVPRARHLYELLAAYARRPVVLGAGGAVWGTTSPVLAGLADLLGDEDAARRHRAEAAADEHLVGSISGLGRWRPRSAGSRVEIPR